MLGETWEHLLSSVKLTLTQSAFDPFNVYHYLQRLHISSFQENSMQICLCFSVDWTPTMFQSLAVWCEGENDIITDGNLHRNLNRKNTSVQPMPQCWALQPVSLQSNKQQQSKCKYITANPLWNFEQVKTKSNYFFLSEYYIYTW